MKSLNKETALSKVLDIFAKLSLEDNIEVLFSSRQWTYDRITESQKHNEEKNKALQQQKEKLKQ